MFTGSDAGDDYLCRAFKGIGAAGSGAEGIGEGSHGDRSDSQRGRGCGDVCGETRATDWSVDGG